LERTHPHAKTIQEAAAFVGEAQRLVEWAERAPELAELARLNRRRVQAGLNVFSARRLIDAGQHRRAVGNLARAMALHPPTAARYWYKIVQGVFSAIGLAPVFIQYRGTRRRLKYRNRRVELPYSAPGEPEAPAAAADRQASARTPAADD
jgi:hypothetical protein